MKKIFLFALSFMLCSTTYAQLVVNNEGKVSVATENEALSKLSVGGAGNTY